MGETRTLLSADERYAVVDQSDGNFVVYRIRADGALIPLWDRFTYEAEHPEPEPGTRPPQ